MQTFMPYKDYSKSAVSLDQQRLGKQRVEAYQILLQLCGMKMVDYPLWEPRVARWNHPAMAMWAGHEVELVNYIEAICNEWTSRGYKDTCLEKSRFVLSVARRNDWLDTVPGWVDNKELHRTHRSNLLRKDPDFYNEKFPEDVPKNDEEYLEYIWPKTEFNLKTRTSENYAKIVELYKNT